MVKKISIIIAILCISGCQFQDRYYYVNTGMSYQQWRDRCMNKYSPDTALIHFCITDPNGTIESEVFTYNEILKSKKAKRANPGVRAAT